MNFADVVTEVMSIVKRPDKMAEVRSAVNATLQYCTTREDFARDLVEITVPIDPAAYAQSLSLSLFPRFRKFRYLKPSNRNLYIEPLSPDKIFVKSACNGKQVEQLDKYYVSGASVVFKLCQTAPNVLAGYYQYPPAMQAAETYWMLDVMPFVIIEGAIAKAFRLLGDDASADRYQGQFLQSFASASKDMKYGTAYG